MFTEVIDQKQWQEKTEFLQSWAYGDFLQTIGRKVLRLEHNNLQIQLLVSYSKFGIKSAYLPRIEIDNEQIIALVEYFKVNKYTFVQIETTNLIKITQEIKSQITAGLQIPDTLILDLNQNNEELLLGMHPKTRYNIKLAEKKSLGVKQLKDFEVYWQLYEQTTERNNFVAHSQKYIREFLKLNNVYQTIIYFEGKPIASSILLHHRSTLYYFFGASANEYRNLMAPYLMQWKNIQLARKLNCEYYDFWGMAPYTGPDDREGECKNNLCWKKDHSFAGISRFKSGFGGQPKTYPPANLIIINNFKYRLYQLINLLKRNKVKTGHSR